MAEVGERGGCEPAGGGSAAQGGGGRGSGSADQENPCEPGGEEEAERRQRADRLPRDDEEGDFREGQRDQGEPEAGQDGASQRRLLSGFALQWTWAGAPPTYAATGLPARRGRT